MSINTEEQMQCIANRMYTPNPYNADDGRSEIDIGNLCVFCGHDTEFGSGRFVNRIPAGTDECEGYACAECMARECDRCDELIAMDEDISPGLVYGEDTERGYFDDGSYCVHMECLTPEEQKSWEQTIEREH